MSRETWRYDPATGRMVQVGADAPRTAIAPAVIRDDMPALVNHADGRTYDSKSNFRRATKAAGCVEIGNERLRDTRRVDLPPMRESIRRAIAELSR